MLSVFNSRKAAVPRPCENLALLEGVTGPSRQAYLFYRSFMYTVLAVGILTVTRWLHFAFPRGEAGEKDFERSSPEGYLSFAKMA